MYASTLSHLIQTVYGLRISWMRENKPIYHFKLLRSLKKKNSRLNKVIVI